MIFVGEQTLTVKKFVVRALNLIKSIKVRQQYTDLPTFCLEHYPNESIYDRATASSLFDEM